MPCASPLSRRGSARDPARPHLDVRVVVGVRGGIVVGVVLARCCQDGPLSPHRRSLRGMSLLGGGQGYITYDYFI